MTFDFTRLKTPLLKILTWCRSHKLRTLGILFFAAIGWDALYLLFVGPSWDELEKGPIPKSNLISAYEERQTKQKLQWRPQDRPFPRAVQRVFIAAEDSRFYLHNGIDLIAIHDAFQYNYTHGKMKFGASTISQQTVKNMFLSPARTPWRKFHEIVLTLWMEEELEKGRILHIYLNIAEFGDGVFGLEAAARHYFKKSAYQLTREEAVELAAALPSPVKHNPSTRTRRFLYRVAKLREILAAY